MIQLLYFLKGIAIGIANVIPGFSGGTMSVILKVYNEFVDALGKIVTNPIQMIKKYYGLYLGLMVGVASALLVIVKLLEVLPLPTVLFFVGLIVGTIPNISLDFKHSGKINWYDVVGIVVAFIVIVGLPLIPGSDKQSGELTATVILSLILCGILASSSMIIPGVSGSLILMVLGYYFFILTSIKDFIKNILSFNFEGILEGVVVLVSFGVGVIVGLIFITKLIKVMFEKTPKLTYGIILGLLFGSPFSIIYSANKDYGEVFNMNNVFIIIASVITLTLGALLSGYIPKKFEKNK